MRTGRQLGILVGLGVIAALGVLSFRTPWEPGATASRTPPIAASSQGDARLPARTRADRSEPPQTPDEDDIASEPAGPDSLVDFDAPELAFSASDRRTDAGVSGPAAGETENAGDLSQGRSPSSTDVERPVAWCFYTTLDHVAVSDSNDVWSGSRSVVIRENGPVAESALRVNALWQAVEAAPYRGARVQLTVQATGGGGLFVFLHGATNRELLAATGQLAIASSNNRYVASIAATGWAELSIVGDIPADADVVFFGVAQNGRASLWVDDVRVTKVGVSSPVTSTPSQNAPLFLRVSPSATLPEPTNLDFEITTETTSGSVANVGGC